LNRNDTNDRFVVPYWNKYHRGRSPRLIAKRPAARSVAVFAQNELAVFLDRGLRQWAGRLNFDLASQVHPFAVNCVNVQNRFDEVFFGGVGIEHTGIPARQFIGSFHDYASHLAMRASGAELAAQVREGCGAAIRLLAQRQIDAQDDSGTNVLEIQVMPARSEERR